MCDATFLPTTAGLNPENMLGWSPLVHGRCFNPMVLQRKGHKDECKEAEGKCREVTQPTYLKR